MKEKEKQHEYFIPKNIKIQIFKKRKRKKRMKCKEEKKNLL